MKIFKKIGKKCLCIAALTICFLFVFAPQPKAYNTKYGELDGQTKTLTLAPEIKILKDGYNFDNQKFVAKDFMKFLEKNSVEHLKSEELLEIHVMFTMFEGYYKLVSINFPNVKHVRDYAFQGNTKLKSVNLPEISYVGQSTFSTCTSLTYVNIEAATRLDMSAFDNCRKLPDINLPNVIQIWHDVFRDCWELETVNAPEWVNYGSSVFENCQELHTVHIPKLVERPGSSIFKNCPNLGKSDTVNPQQSVK